MLTEFEFWVLSIAIYGAVMATIAAIWSIWVLIRYGKKEKQVDASHRNIRATLHSFESSAVQMMEITQQLFLVMQKSDPVAIQRAVEAIEGIKLQLEDLPTAVMRKSRATMGAEAKKEYRIQREIMSEVDELVTEETMSAYGQIDDGQIAKFIVPIVAEYPEFRGFAVKYAMGRIQAVQQGGTQAIGAKAHPLG